MPVIKIIQRPVVAFYIFSRYFYTVCLALPRKLMYKKIGFLTYVSLRTSIKNHDKISLGNRVQINPFVVLWPSELEIGAFSQINPGTALYGKIKIGRYVMIAPNCMLAGGNHIYKDDDTNMMYQGSTTIGIVIDDDVWVGANTTIIDGVKIGRGAVIGANSIVTKDIPAYAVAFGSPAVVVKWRKQ